MKNLQSSIFNLQSSIFNLQFLIILYFISINFNCTSIELPNTNLPPHIGCTLIDEEIALNSLNCRPICYPTDCTRKKLLACDFTLMMHYCFAVTCELNKASMNCNLVGANDNNCNYTTKTIINLAKPTQYIDLHPGVDPWKYCTLASCEEKLCSINEPTYHPDLTIQDQDILVSYAYCVANTFGQQIGLGTSIVSLYFKSCQTGSFECGIGTIFPCTNLQICLEVTYKTCNLIP